jgi:hypothetical protein
MKKALTAALDFLMDAKQVAEQRTRPRGRPISKSGGRD